MSKKVGVILSGCGFLDGAEVHESVLTLLNLDRAGAEAVCYAPNKIQMHVVDHASGNVAEGQERNVLAESARIARGKIHDLGQARVEDLDAVIMPGGFGAAKNLSNFASAGADAEVDATLVELLRGMLAAGKPIGVICISPAVLAAALRGTEISAKLTIGSDAGTAAAIEAMGATHENCEVTEFTVDETNLIASTPAYMCDARISEVEVGIGKLVGAVLSMIS